MQLTVLDEPKEKDQLNILTWHIHGSYLYYLTQAQHQFYLPVKSGRPEGYGGRSGSFAWGENVHEIPAEDVKNLHLDCVLFQSKKNYLEDQFEILSPAQRDIPQIYLEHDPPREQPTDTCHWVDDPNILLVHVTHFNQLMWDSNRTPTRVIEHGVIVPSEVRYTGEIPKGIVVVNNLPKRGRRLGLDIFDEVRQKVPLDLIGIGSEEIGGLGPIPLDKTAELISQYRFFFNPIRYTSLGLAVCEAMMIGMPVIGLATTEMSTSIENGISGWVDTDVQHLIHIMKDLIDNAPRARLLSEGARKQARKRFGIERYKADWDAVFTEAASRKLQPAPIPETILGEGL